MDSRQGGEGLGQLSLSEYAVLRQTIATRGTARMLVAPASCLGWAALVVTVGWDGPPTDALWSLAVLVAGFESVHALHVGTERIGRYLQVFYEGVASGPRWESTAMAVGPALPGGGIDPLFSMVFVGTALLGLWRVCQPPLVTPSFGVTLACHAAFVVRVIRARTAATRQRSVELESFKTLHSQK